MPQSVPRQAANPEPLFPSNDPEREGLDREVLAPVPGTEENRLLPWQPPPWELPDAAGRRHLSAELQGKPTLLIFYRGNTCSHCLQQLRLMQDYARTPEAMSLGFVAISPDSPEILARTQDRPAEGRILLLSDEKAVVFRQFSCYAEDFPQHGIFLLSSAGQVVWSCISEEPFTDLTALRREVEKVRGAGPGGPGNPWTSP